VAPLLVLIESKIVLLQRMSDAGCKVAAFGCRLDPLVLCEKRDWGFRKV
jgi:hypothetical protein